MPQNALKLKREVLQRAQSALELAQRTADGANAALALAEETLDQRVKRWVQASGVVASWDQVKEDTESAAQKADLDAQQKGQAELAGEQERKASAMTPAKLYLGQLSSWVPPSHKQLLNECEGSSDALALDICIAKTIARINDVQNLELVPCSGSGPTLSEDGGSLLIPPSPRPKRASGPTAEMACGKVALKDLIGGQQDELADPARGSFDTVALLHPNGAAL